MLSDSRCEALGEARTASVSSVTGAGPGWDICLDGEPQRLPQGTSLDSSHWLQVALATANLDANP